MQRTDALARPAPVCKRDGKELSNTIRNRSRNDDRVSSEGEYLPNPFQVDVGGSYGKECAKKGKVEKTCFCLCAKGGEGNELPRGLEICMKRPELKKQILPTVYSTIDILEVRSLPLSPSLRGCSTLQWSTAWPTSPREAVKHFECSRTVWTACLTTSVCEMHTYNQRTRAVERANEDH
jgi:hypothetical protein